MHWTIIAIRLGAAAVWLVFGLGFKVLGGVPRHRTIVAAVVGEGAAGPVTVLVGLAETAIALWILSGLWPRACAAVQTVALASMNALELLRARDLLLAPLPMVLANAAFLGLVWYAALHSGRRRPRARKATTDGG
ncbi:MAG: hypothetical protein D6696_12820 [Acidobacteria bacterium]|nr:MAG: hypothetical protein D6696_12820 [Acidobacteriota bacterium]